MKAATVYERRGKLYLHGLSKTSAGIWVINATAFTVDKGNTDEIGRLIRKCLETSHEGIPHPKSFAGLFDPILELADVKSFDTFVKLAKCVEVESGENGIVTFIPTRNQGAEEGFAPLTQKMEADLTSDAALGSAVIAAVAISE